jgi:hypothetical protein
LPKRSLFRIINRTINRTLEGRHDSH